MDLLSVIIPLRNKGGFIQATLESIVDQPYEKLEMLFVENGSTDCGPDIVREFAQKDQRIRLIQAPEEVRGPGAARNLGI